MPKKLPRRRVAPPTGLGARLHDERTKRGLTLAALGDGQYTRSFISAIEKERVRPSIEAITFFATRLGVAIATLVGDDPTFAGAARPSRTDAAHPLPALEGLQHDVRVSLSELDPFYAALYDGALGILAWTDNPDRIALAAHGLRELMEKYARRGGEDSVAPHDRLGPRTDALADQWRKTRNMSAAYADGDWSGVIDPALGSVLSAVDAHIEWAGDRQPKDLAMRAKIEALGDSTPAQVDRAIRTWRRLEDYFTDVAHHTQRPTDEEFAERREALERFLLRLHRPERRTMELLHAIDGLVAEGESKRITPALLDRIVGLLAQRRDVEYRHLFERLPTAKWIKPLRTAKFFADPPAPIHHPGNQVSFPAWPESEYLARVADQEPALVAEILTALPPSDNPIVHYDVVKAALALPIEHAAALARLEARWIGAQSWLFPLLPIEYGKLTARLARNGKPRPALELARAMFALAAPAPPTSAAVAGFRPRPRTLMDPYEYAQTLASVLPSLVEADARGILDLISHLLRTCVEIASPDGVDDGEDYSDVWVRDLGEGTITDAHDAREALILALRDALARVVPQQSRAAIGAIVTRLESQRWLIFTRLVLHTLANAPAEAEPIVRARLLDPDLRTRRGVRHEQTLLLRRWFGKLAGDAQAQILSVIAAGPGATHLRTIGQARLDRPPTEDEMVMLKDRWIFEQLGPIAEVLPAEWRLTYERLAARFGPVADAPRTARPAVWTGTRSPKTTDELLAMDDDALFAFLSSWSPPAVDPFAESLEGLGNALATAVALAPARFAQYAPRLRGHRATIVRSVLDGFQQAVPKNEPFEWAPVLALCAWALEQPHSASDRAASFDLLQDPHWGWTRMTIVRLVELGCEGRPNAIPFDLRGRVWELIARMADDPDPEGEVVERVSDPVTHGINTVRGRALETAVQYALWTARRLRETEPGHAITFSRIPEVADLLEARFDASRERSLGVRAILGLALPQLAALDERWLADHVAALFDLPDELDHLRRATWEAYCVYSNPYDNVFALLREQYVIAVGQLDETPLAHGGTDPRERLVEHLMVFLIRGLITRDDDDHLLDRFYATASPALRQHAIEFVGRLLEEAGPTAPAAALERLRALWSWRLDSARAAKDHTSYDEEIGAFGSWFRTASFDVDWTLAQLHAVLETVGRVGPVRFIVDRLAVIASARPNDALLALRAIARAEPDDLRLSTSGGIEQVVRIGLAHEATRTLAAEVGDELLALGYQGVRAVLEEPRA